MITGNVFFDVFFASDLPFFEEAAFFGRGFVVRVFSDDLGVFGLPLSDDFFRVFPVLVLEGEPILAGLLLFVLAADFAMVVCTLW